MSLPSRNTIIFVVVLLCYVVLLRLVYINFPALRPEEKEHFKLPKSIDEAKQLGKIFLRCKDDNYYVVLATVCVIYTFLQSFAIPGSIMLTVVSGYLFPFFTALFLVCSCSAFGASVCYFISHLVVRRLVIRYVPKRVEDWQREVEKERDNMYNYMFFLRVTPILPNWFINLAGPIVKVPLAPFFFGTFFGVMPPSFLMIRAGTELQQLSDSDLIYSSDRLLVMLLCGAISILPILYRRYCAKTTIDNNNEEKVKKVN